MRTFSALVAIVMLLQIASARTPPASVDFSGTWTWDATRSDHRAAADIMVVTQSATAVVIHATLCCRQAGEQWITTYHFDKWGSRNATRGSVSTPPRGSADDKPTQARWDGETLVMHAGPELDVRGGSVRVWRLAANGAEMREEIVNRGLGLRFDFKVASIPRMYTRDRHVYLRQTRN